MAECRYCGRKFHACSNCSLDYNWESHYCTRKHWESSAEYQISCELITAFLDSLTYAQLKMFKEINSLDEDYWCIIENSIENFTGKA